MPGKLTPEQRQLRALKNEVDRLQREVRALKDILNVKDNWHAEVQSLIGKPVWLATDWDANMIRGTLLWTDRYNICVQVQDQRRIYNKGGITWLAAGDK